MQMYICQEKGESSLKVLVNLGMKADAYFEGLHYGDDGKNQTTRWVEGTRCHCIIFPPNKPPAARRAKGKEIHSPYVGF